MFSSVLPGVSTNVKFMHNPSSKSSNRYVKSSTNPNVTYLANHNLYDLGYLSILPTEGPPANWYPNSSYNPPYGQDYAIYSNFASNTFNYDQSAQFLDFEDTSSIGTVSTISPAMSTASLEAQKSPVDSESLIYEFDISDSENRVIQTSFPFPISSSQVAGRTLSTHPVSGDHISDQDFSSSINLRSATPFQSVTADRHQMPRALHPSFPSDLIEDNQSTISELEVEERDRIAKMNAEYNAISHPGSLKNSPSPPKYSPDRSRESNSALQLSSMQTRPYPPLSVSQPRHPDLHFLQRQIGNEKKEVSSSPYRIYASPVSISQDLSPPSVERLPSQLSPEQNLNTNRTPPQSRSSPPASSHNHEGTSDLDCSRIVQNDISKSSPTGFIHSTPQTVNPQLQSWRVERGQTQEPSPVVPSEIARKPTSPVMIAGGQSLTSDVQESLQYKQQSRPGAPSLIQPSTTAKNHLPSYNTSPDSRQFMDDVKSSPRAQINKTTELETTERVSLVANLRSDTKTPGLSGRGYSYESPSTSSQNVDISPDMRSKNAHKSSPKGFMDERSGNPDNGRSVAEASLLSSDSISSSSNRSLLHDDAILRRTTRDADHDREFERHRRPRSTVTERPAILRFTDETCRGTAPMHTQSPLHISPEGAPVTFLQPDSQVVSVVPPSEHRPTDLRHSKTVYEQASVPNSLDSRESRKVHERHYVDFSKPHPETAKYERNGMRMLPSVLQSPVNNFATTSSSLPSKVILDFPSTPTPPEPHRRHSDGDQVGHPIRPPLSGRNSAPLVRSVRWTEYLIAPSPILAPPRRKGWFNRRGDQLWTNNGDYRPPRSGDEYPLDLNEYPEPGDGWMNEDGVRIDTSHCRIPKALPRPALKKP